MIDIEIKYVCSDCGQKFDDKLEALHHESIDCDEQTKILDKIAGHLDQHLPRGL